MKWICIVLLLVLTASPSFAQTVQLPTMRFGFAEPLEADEARDLLNAGIQFFENGKYTEASARFGEILKKHARNVVADRASYMQMRTLVKLNKRTDALALADSFLKTYTKSPWIPDVRELRVSLTSEVSPEVLMALPQRPPQAPVASTPTPTPPSAPPAPPTFIFSGQAPTPMPFPRGPRPGVEENPEIRFQQEALRVLFENNAESAIQIATDRLKADPTDVVILSSLNMVANSRSEKALPLLVTLAKTAPESRTRRDAINWIGRARGEKDVIADILVSLVPSMTGDEDSTAIAYSLRQLNTPKAFDALAAMARDKSKLERLRLEAISSIGEARLTNRVALLEEIYKASSDSPRIRRKVLDAYARGKEPQVVPALVNVATTDADTNLRISAVNYLGQVKTPEAITALENLLKKK